MSKISFKILRFFHFTLFSSTAIGKLLDNRGFAEVIASYQFGIPRALLLPLALTISLAELCLAIAIMSAPFRNNEPHSSLSSPLSSRISRRLSGCLNNQNNISAICFAVNIAYLLLAVVSLERGLTLKNCGCFGVFIARPLSNQTVIEDAILASLSAAYFLLSRRRTAC